MDIADWFARTPPGRDIRAQSVGIGIFVLSLIVGILLFVLFEKPVYTVHDTANSTVTNQTALDGLNNSIAIFEALPVIFIAIGAVGTLIWAVYSSDIP